MKFNRTSGTEGYLKAATRGLWGRQRRALRAELRGHISARVQEFRLGGLSESDAERQTLRELGAPVQVSSGMLGVHTLPALGKAGVLTVLLATGLLTVLPQGLAQVGSILDSRFGIYVDLRQLQAEFKKSGGDVVMNGKVLSIAVPGVSGLSFSGHVVTPTWLPSLAVDADQLPTLSMVKKGRTYVNLSTLLASFTVRSSSIPVSVSGWKSPVLSIGGAKVPIVGNTRNVAEQLYLDSIFDTIPQLTGGRNLITFDPLRHTELSQHTFSGAFESGKVYALLTSLPDQTGMQMMATAITQANSSKEISFNAPAVGTLKLYRDAPNFQRGLTAFELAETKRKNRLEYKADPLNPYPAVLLKLSGHFGRDAYTVVDPATVKGTLQDH